MFCSSLRMMFVKVQSKVQSSVLGVGVDFVLPLSQQDQEQPHQNKPEGNILEVLNLAKSLPKPNSCHPPPYINATFLPLNPLTLTLPCYKK